MKAVEKVYSAMVVSSVTSGEGGGRDERLKQPKIARLFGSVILSRKEEAGGEVYKTNLLL